VRALPIVLLAACGTARSPALDGPPGVDAPPSDGTPDDGAGVYSHTITIDGVDDFVASETFPTTSTGYTARVAWDADNLYIGYSGPDLDPTALDTSTKWMFVYLDLDPDQATGATQSELYNTQRATFPSGFSADLYARWKCDATFDTLEHFDGGDLWSTIATPVGGHAGDFVEFAIPRAQLGGAQVVGLVTWMINEKPNFEGSFAGLYADNFVDGYAQDLSLTGYLKVDFTSTAAPNDPANRAP